MGTALWTRETTVLNLARIIDRESASSFRCSARKTLNPPITSARRGPILPLSSRIPTSRVFFFVSVVMSFSPLVNGELLYSSVGHTVFPAVAFFPHMGQRERIVRRQPR